jgi:hypothetical protein
MACAGNLDGLPQTLDERRRRFDLQLVREASEIAIAIERERQKLEVNLLEIMHERISVYKKAGMCDAELIALVRDQMSREIPLRLNLAQGSDGGGGGNGPRVTRSAAMAAVGPLVVQSVAAAAADTGTRQHGPHECPSCVVHAGPGFPTSSPAPVGGARRE